MALIVGPGAQGAKARGRIGSTVFQGRRGLPGGTVIARTHNPWPNDPGILAVIARRVVLSMTTKWWNGTFDVAAGDAIDQEEWNTYADPIAGFRALHAASQLACSHNGWCSPTPGAPVPLTPCATKGDEVTVDYFPDDYLVAGFCSFLTTTDPSFHLLVSLSHTAVTPATMPTAVYLSPKWDGGGVPEPVPFAFVVPKSLRLPGTILTINCAAIGPNLTPGETASDTLTIP